MSEINNRSPEQLFLQAKQIHSKNKTSSRQFQNTLEYIQDNIQQSFSFISCSLCGSKFKSNVDEAFKRGFKTLTLKQKINYFWKLCCFSQKVQKNSNKQIQGNKDQKDSRQMLDTTIYIKIDNQYPKWTVTQVIISKVTHKLTIVERSKTINLKNYIMRASNNKQKQAFALESISSLQSYKTIRISNEGHSFAVTQKYLKETLDSAAKQNIQDILKLKTSQSKNINKSLNSSEKMQSKIKIPSLQDKMMTFRLISPQYYKKDSKTIQRELIQKQKILKSPDSTYQLINAALVNENIIKNLNSLDNFTKIKGDQNLGVYYHKTENKVKKIYKFKCNQIIIFDWLVDQLNNFSTFHKWKQNMHQITCLKIFPCEKTKLFYQIFKHPQKMHYIFIRHYFQRPNLAKQKQQSRNDKIHYFFDKSIDKNLAKQYFKIPEPIPQVNYILWKFQAVNDQLNLTVQGECDYYLARQKNLSMIDDYLGNFQKIKQKLQGEQQQQQSDIMINTFLFENQYIEQINQLQNQGGDTEYFSISQQNQQSNNITVQKKPILKNNSLLSSKKSVSFEQILTQTTDNVLKFKHPRVPFKKGPPLLRKPLYGDHIQWEKQWLINEKGDVICIDKKKIDAQNGVMKSVFKKIGKNIFGGKSILSISLPVQVFGDDSNLSRLCHSYGYAPLFLQKAKQCENTIQGFLNVIAFSLTASVLYLRMDKPFNPILGQTYQGLVDGCPIYGQQISHHPPISSVFLKGRGYTLYGSLEAKVQMSLNSAAGSNQGAMHVSFDPHDLKKKVIKYSAPAGEVSGIMYGDRKFLFVKKSYFFDQQNLFFCQLTWSKHKGKSQYCKFNDSVQGQVVRLKKGFNKQNWKNVKKQDIQEQFQFINGRWTSAVYYGKNVLFDTYKQFPYKLQNYPAILQSDSSKRKDLNLRRIAVGDDMDAAQQAKDQLQQIQRNDRKLRAKYHGGKQH